MSLELCAMQFYHDKYKNILLSKKYKNWWHYFHTKGRAWHLHDSNIFASDGQAQLDRNRVLRAVIH